MSLNNLTPGRNIPDDLNVIIEISAHSTPVKYEVDKDTGLLHVDRFQATSMIYPFNYGFVPKTLCDDGDPLDMMVLAPFSIYPGSVVRAKPIGVLLMRDEAGIDPKILAVPVQKLSKLYDNVHDYTDIPISTRESIEHFFKHYKDLDKGKWVELQGWQNMEKARKIVQEAVSAYQE
ncbi:MAG: inorganic diphosphatase [Pseudomonadota bacterium]|nr:inorganic diphosphatase [Pseudomonadota bacterium]